MQQMFVQHLFSSARRKCKSRACLINYERLPGFLGFLARTHRFVRVDGIRIVPRIAGVEETLARDPPFEGKKNGGPQIAATPALTHGASSRSPATTVTTLLKRRESSFV